MALTWRDFMPNFEGINLNGVSNQMDKGFAAFQGFGNDMTKLNTTMLNDGTQVATEDVISKLRQESLRSLNEQEGNYQDAGWIRKQIAQVDPRYADRANPNLVMDSYGEQRGLKREQAYNSAAGAAKEKYNTTGSMADGSELLEQQLRDMYGMKEDQIPKFAAQFRDQDTGTISARIGEDTTKNTQAFKNNIDLTKLKASDIPGYLAQAEQAHPGRININEVEQYLKGGIQDAAGEQERVLRMRAQELGMKAQDLSMQNTQLSIDAQKAAALAGPIEWKSSINGDNITMVNEREGASFSVLNPQGIDKKVEDKLAKIKEKDGIMFGDGLSGSYEANRKKMWIDEFNVQERIKADNMPSYKPKFMSIDDLDGEQHFRKHFNVPEPVEQPGFARRAYDFLTDPFGSNVPPQQAPVEQVGDDSKYDVKRAMAELTRASGQGAGPLQEAIAANNASADTPPNYGNRPDGTPKGSGFLGELVRPDGGVSTEVSVGVSIDGKQVDIPTLVPGLSTSQINSVLNLKGNEKPPKAVIDIAVKHAKERIAKGLSPFAGADESPATDGAKILRDKAAAKSGNVKEFSDPNWQDPDKLKGRNISIIKDTINNLSQGIESTPEARKARNSSTFLRQSPIVTSQPSAPSSIKATPINSNSEVYANMMQGVKSTAKSLRRFSRNSSIPSLSPEEVSAQSASLLRRHQTGKITILEYIVALKKIKDAGDRY
jgi:hypothetical protein